MANYDVVQNAAVIRNDSLPATGAEGTIGQLRASTYGELVTTSLYGSRMKVLADEGSFFTAVNPTAGTGIIDTAALTGFVTTTPTMVVVNSNSTGGKSLYLESLRLNVTAAGTSGTNWSWAMYVDTGNRYSSGGSQITPNNINMLASNSTGALVYFGAITATAANSQRKIAASPGRTVIKVVGDEYRWTFGDSSPAPVGMPMEGTLQIQRHFHAPPVVIPPGCSFCFYEWGASQGTAAGFEFQLNYFER
jgi:hypothetical protein